MLRTFFSTILAASLLGPATAQKDPAHEIERRIVQLWIRAGQTERALERALPLVPAADHDALKKAFRENDDAAIQKLVGVTLRSAWKPALDVDAVLRRSEDDPGAIDELLHPRPGQMFRGGSGLGGLLHDAAGHSHPAAVRAVLDERADDLEARDLIGRTPVHVAAASGRVSNLHVLARHGADLFTCDGQGWNALHHAAFHGHLHACRWLLERGLEVHATDVHGRTALTLAASGMRPGASDLHQRREIVARLRERGVAVDILAATVLDEHEIVRREIEAGRRPSWHLAVRAIAFDHSALLVEFLEAGLPLASVDPDGDTLLHEAARAGAPNSLAVLLDRGADVQAQNEWGETPLHAAVRGHSKDAVQILLAAGARREACNEDGKRAIDLIARDRWPNLTALLERR